MTLLFAAVIFFSSALLFWLEPLFGKLVLPLLGGAPAVWNACILFYQIALLAGYGWAHAATRLGPKRHAALHLGLCVVAISVLPFSIPATLLPPSNEWPLAWLLIVLAAGVGLPFTLVAANGPLLQLWFTRSSARRAADPYFLYAASNLGSAAALLLFPVVLERTLTLPEQSRWWRAVYMLMVLLLASCALPLLRRGSVDAAPAANDTPAEAIRWSRRLRWVALAAIPSSLMLGVTTYISSELAPVPLIWILPLALYLLTLVVAFAATARLTRWLNGLFAQQLTLRFAVLTVLGLGVVSAMYLSAAMVWGAGPSLVVTHLLLFTSAALVCHVLLAGARPGAARLTEFYLWTAVGGTLGGMFNTLIGPVAFNAVLEYPLALTAVLMVLPARPRNGQRSAMTWPDLAWPVAFGLLTAVLGFTLSRTDAVLAFPTRLLLAVPAAACLAFAGRPVRFGGGLAAVVLASTSFPSEIGTVEHAQRNFFGVHRVLRDDRNGFRWLTHGITVHGGERLADTIKPYPLTYYTPSGPAGDAFRVLGSARRVGAIGLGAGALMYYARPGQSWTIFEIDPEVISIATTRFDFLRRAAAAYRIVVGDARLSLARDTSHYDLLVLDAFGSDAIPTHLLTREAVGLYFSRLSPGGVLLMHISHRFLDLSPVVERLATDAGLASIRRMDLAPDDTKSTGKFGSHWAALARDPAALDALAAMPGWVTLEAAGHLRVWTDDYSSVLPLFRNWSN